MRSCRLRPHQSIWTIGNKCSWHILYCTDVVGLFFFCQTGRIHCYRIMKRSAVFNTVPAFCTSKTLQKYFAIYKMCHKWLTHTVFQTKIQLYITSFISKHEMVSCHLHQPSPRCTHYFIGTYSQQYWWIRHTPTYGTTSFESTRTETFQYAFHKILW